MRNRSVHLRSILILLLATSAIELAAEEPRPTSPERLKPVVLEEIIVTALKKPQSIQEVPISITAIGRDLLRDGDISQISELESVAPNVVLNVDANDAEVRIRGFGTSSGNDGFEPAVGTVIDGVFYGRSSFLSSLFFDMDQVEIIRGPQSTIYGKNTTAGVINLTSAAADADTDNSFDVLTREANELRIRSGVNLAINDDLTGRLAGIFWASDGTLYNSTLDQQVSNVDMRGARLKLRWLAGSNSELDWAAFDVRQKTKLTVGQSYHTQEELLAAMRSYDPGVETDPFNHRTYQNFPGYRNHITQGTHLLWRYQLPWSGPFDSAELNSVSGWARVTTPNQDADIDYSPMPALIAYSLKPERYQQWVQELRLSASNSSFDLTTGVFTIGSKLSSSFWIDVEDYPAAFVYVTSAAADANLPDGSVGGLFGSLTGELAPFFSEFINPSYGALNSENAVVDFAQKTVAWSIFSQLDWTIKPWVTMTLGIRYGQEKKRGRFSSQGQGIFIPTILGQENHESNGSRDETELSPRIAFKFQLTETLNSYISWARGFKSGGFNGIPYTPENLVFEPEQTDNYEFGLKSHFWNRKLTLNAAVFNTNFSNLQTTDFDGVRFVIRNAAEANAQGFELEMSWSGPIKGTGIRLAVGHANTEYTHYPNGPAISGSGEDSQDLTGRVLIRAPRWTAGIIPSVSFPWPGQNMAINFATDVLYMSGRYLDSDLDPVAYQKGTVKLNARMTFIDLEGSWNFALFARNVSEERWLEGVTDQPGASGSYIAFQGDEGRQLGAELRFNF